MENDREINITVRIADFESFSLPIRMSQEALYRELISKINRYVDRFRFSSAPDSGPVALAKVALYYATMLYRCNEQLNRQSQLLADMEQELDNLLGHRQQP